MYPALNTVKRANTPKYHPCQLEGTDQICHKTFRHSREEPALAKAGAGIHTISHSTYRISRFSTRAPIPKILKSWFRQPTSPHEQPQSCTSSLFRHSPAGPSFPHKTFRHSPAEPAPAKAGGGNPHHLPQHSSHFKILNTRPNPENPDSDNLHPRINSPNP